MKRIISLLLCLLLMAGMVITASAVDLTIQGQTGHEYVAFQIFKGTIGNTNNENSKDVLGNAVWGNGIDYQNFLKYIQYAKEHITDSNGNSLGFSLADRFNGINENSAPEDVAKVMAEWGDDRDIIKYFAEFLFDPTWKDVPAGETAPTTLLRNAIEQNETTTTFTNLDPGYYLIMDKAAYEGDTLDMNTADFYTRIMMNLTTTGTITVKGSVPTVDKMVSNHLTGPYYKTISNQINLDHYYKLTGKVASDIGDYDTYYYEFVDTLENGLTFGAVQQVYIQRNNNEVMLYDGTPTGTARIWVPVLENTEDPDNIDERNVIVNGNTVNGSTVRIILGDVKGFNGITISSGDEIVVRYTAHLNTGAVVGDDGNVNTAYVRFGNNPYGSGTGKTETSQARVYTFKMEAKKVNEKGAALPGADFLLYHYHDNTKLYAKVENGIITSWFEDTGDAVVPHILAGGDPVNVETEPDRQYQYETNAEKYSALGEKGVTVLSSQEDGMIRVTGLKEHTTYYLKEINAPDGYNLPVSDTEVLIESFTVNAEDNKVSTLSYDVNNVPYTLTVGTDEQGNAVLPIVKLENINKAGTTLPTTGGMGTTLIYAAGAILVLAAVVLLITKKRMRDAA